MSSDEDLPPPPQMEKSSAASTARSLPPEQPPTAATPAAAAAATPPEPEVAADKDEAAATGVPASTSSFLNHVSLCFCTIVETLAGVKAVHRPDKSVMNFRVLCCSHLYKSY